MVEQPGGRWTVRLSESAEGPKDPATAVRVPRPAPAWFATLKRDLAGAGFEVPGCELQHSLAIPRHCGLGSGTQRALASATAVLKVAGREVDEATLPAILGRGTRSSVGSVGFFRGGMMVDLTDEPVRRSGFPREWPVLLMTPRKVSEPMFGSSEQASFATLPRPSDRHRHRLHDLASGPLQQSVVNGDFATFADCVTEFNGESGRMFGPLQNGPYRDQAVQSLVQRIRSAGRFGVGQSSWGPTVFVICETEEHADWLIRQIADETASIIRTRAKNDGAEVSV